MMMLHYVIRIISRLYIINRDTQHIHVSEAVFQKKQRKEIPYELISIMNGIIIIMIYQTNRVMSQVITMNFMKILQMYNFIFQ